jgi:hypothetical protein
VKQKQEFEKSLLNVYNCGNSGDVGKEKLFTILNSKFKICPKGARSEAQNLREDNFELIILLALAKRVPLGAKLAFRAHILNWNEGN